MIEPLLSNGSDFCSNTGVLALGCPPEEVAFCGLVTSVVDLCLVTLELFGEPVNFSADGVLPNLGTLPGELQSFSEEFDLSSFSSDDAEILLEVGESVFVFDRVIGLGSELSLWNASEPWVLEIH